MALPDVVLRRKTQVTPLTKSLFSATKTERAGSWIKEKGQITADVVDFKSEKGTKVMPHPDKSFKLYQQIYQKVPVAKCSIDSTVNFAIQSGYELEGPKGAVKKVEEWIDQVNFDLIMMDAMKQMQIYGNAWLEISDITSPKFLPVNQMFVVVHSGDENDGQIKDYKQIINETEEISFEKEEIVHFLWNRESGLGNGFYGISDLKASTTVLTRLLNFQEDIGEVMHHHAKPIIQWIIGTEDSPGTQPQIDDFKTNLADRETGGDLITSFGVEGKTIASDLRMVQPDGMLKHLENQLISALQVPEIFVRGGETSNKATADVELQAFDRRVKAIRGVVSRFVEDFIFPTVVESRDKVKIVWNEPSFETEAKKAEMVKNLVAGNTPLEVALKIVGWGAYIDDLEEAGGEKEPTPPMGQEPPEKSDEPKEEDFETQEDWLNAHEAWKQL